MRQIIGRSPERLAALHQNVAHARSALAKLAPVGLKVEGGELGESPLIHARLEDDSLDDDSRYEAIQVRTLPFALCVRLRCSAKTVPLVAGFQAALKDEGILIAISNYSTLEASPPPPTLRWTVTCEHTAADIDKMVGALERAIGSTAPEY